MSEANPQDGLGWYVVEIDEQGRQALRDDRRYNLREAALSWARFRFPTEVLGTRFWDGKVWGDEVYR